MEQGKAQRKARILLVDDHPIVRQGLAQVIDLQTDMEMAGQAEDAEGALDCVATGSPDLAIVDLSLGDTHGLELIKVLRTQYPELAILVLSMHDESLYAERVLRAGARGYVSKQSNVDSVLDAIRRVLRGELALSRAMADRMLLRIANAPSRDERSGIERLSDRELEVFELLGRGIGTRQIAEKLGLSVKTVETHRARIKAKLNVKSSAELMLHAVRWVQTEA